ncbi:MAG TPA: OPT/YSL family transporter [Planctomycetota bacterium]|nr:OPT/YSL family transporter [Planctomycetota bacterium]
MSHNEPDEGVVMEPGVKPAHIREFTLRSVLVGLLVAVVIGASYPYVVMKLGFGPNISVVSAFFGFLALGLICKTFNRWENNIVESAGTAAGQTAFLCTLLVAFDLLDVDKSLGIDIHLGWWQIFLWLSIAGTMGVLLAVPMRQHFVVDEKLPYADGIAAAQTLIILDSKGPQAKRSAFAMVGAAVAAGTHFVLKTYKLLIDALPIAPAGLFKGGLGAEVLANSAKTGVGVSLGLLSFGSGMIIGVRICLSMLLGGTLSWIVATTWLTHSGGDAGGAYLQGDWTRRDVLLWVMWPATGMLTAGGLTSLVLKWKILKKSFRSLTGAGEQAGTDFPIRWVGIGIAVLTVALVAFQYFSLGQPWWVTLLAILFSLPLVLVSLRVLGETNWGPISALSNIMQGVFGMIRPGNIAANMTAAGVTGSVVAESEGLMQDYKVGYLLGTTPRYLTYMQLMAVPVGAATVASIYPLLQPKVMDGTLTSPISQKWVGFAKILSKGIEAVPSSALWALAVATVLGIVLTILEQKPSSRKWCPSPTGVGIGMLVPFGEVAVMCVGSFVGAIWLKKSAQTARHYLIPIASGFIAGEALLGIVIPALCKLEWIPFPPA